jgi:tripartite-type tricarboxylate transporter receptor subunit TctC
MNTRRRRLAKRGSAMKLLHSFSLVLGIVAAQDASLAQAQPYPTRPITLISPTTAGSGNDMICRILGAQLAERLGKPVIIENRPGAGFVTGTTAGARAAPDGYTLALPGSYALAASVTIYRHLPYDPRKDFAPVALVSEVPSVLAVHPTVPARSVTEFVAFMKATPVQLSYASGGPGTPSHLLVELFKTMTGVQMMHIPYKGSAQAVADVVAGHVSVTFADALSALPLIEQGKLRALGVSTKTRLASAPQIPPLAEAGVPGFDAAAWVMVVAPARTPGNIVNRLHAELRSISAQPNIQQQLLKLGVMSVISPPVESLQPFINSEIVRWADVVRRAGIAGSE